MAELLYRLGFGSSKRPWTVISSWLVVLALAVGGFLAFGGTLTSSITIPGTPTSQVTDRLTEEFPEAANGAGSVVFRTADGSEFTAEQEQQITDLMAEVGDTEGVDSTLDPFTTEQQKADGQRDLEDGRAELEAGSQQLEDGQSQLDDAVAQLDAAQTELDSGQEQLDAGQAQLDEARAQAEAAGAPAATMAQLQQQQAALDAQQEELDAARAQLDEGRGEIETNQATLDESAQELADGETELAQGEQMLALTQDYRTVSEDGTAAVGTVSFTLPAMEVEQAIKDEVVSALTEADIAGVEVLPANDLSQAIPQIAGPAEVIGLVIAGIVLFIMLGTLVAAGLPILTALIGVAIGAAGTLAFSGMIDMLSVTPVLGLMLGLAVGIDYALFIINRHRRQLKDGVPLHESIGLATGTSGNAVVFAGLTVVIALAALNVTGIPFLGLMGTVGAVCVALAVLIAISMMPALLGLAKYRVLSKKERAAADATVAAATRTASTGKHTADAEHASSTGRAPRPMSTVRAVLTAVGSVVLLAVIAIPFFSMRLGLPDGASEPPESASYQAYETLGEKFGEGRNGPLVVTADLPEGLTDTEIVDEQLAVAEQLQGIESVTSVVPAAVSEDNGMAMFQVIPEGGPNAVTTEELVHTLRATEPESESTNLAVAGTTSGFVDVAEKLADALPLYLGVVVGLSLIIMIVVFRSLLVPLIATGGFILSAFAAMGGVVAIYQWGWLASVFQVHNPAPILAFLPTIMVGVLFGLAMDYQLFISTGMREAYAHGSSARVAVQQGLKAGRSVVIAAAIIMISVFGGFVFSESAMIRPIGFGLAFGVLVDAFVVRLLLIPALMHLFGDAAWWLPKWLDRILPNVDVEGASLERSHGYSDPELAGADGAGGGNGGGPHGDGGDGGGRDDDPALTRV
ncbi:MMPL family transporter [Citricoccus sp. K5]|uniref:MMPL family transporter n=1 Tax=Citricoccus sp. K5 TaxID=2653135 RepID=UPI0012F035BD|nr:MMPL family transporter [Citricoccus sp. K5]VXB80071.1 putative RND superfamily drug exporter [Citricoccus sp. K5]